MINKWIGVGRVGKKPEISYTQNGGIIAKFSIATDEKWKDKNTGEKRSVTSWHKITIFGNLASIVEQYVDKGSLLYIEGKISYGSYEKDGVTRYTTDIIANQMQMLGSKGDVVVNSDENGEDVPF